RLGKHRRERGDERGLFRPVHVPSPSGPRRRSPGAGLPKGRSPPASAAIGPVRLSERTEQRGPAHAGPTASPISRARSRGSLKVPPGGGDHVRSRTGSGHAERDRPPRPAHRPANRTAYLVTHTGRRTSCPAL